MWRSCVSVDNYVVCMCVCMHVWACERYYGQRIEDTHADMQTCIQTCCFLRGKITSMQGCVHNVRQYICIHNVHLYICMQVDALAVPIIIHRDDIEKVAPMWLSITETIRADRDTWLAAWKDPWYASYPYVCVCVYEYIYIYIYTHTHIHTYICTHTYTHTHTHTLHTCTHASGPISATFEHMIQCKI